MVHGRGDNFHEGRMLPCIYDEPLTGSNSAAFKCVEACHCQGISILRSKKRGPNLHNFTISLAAQGSEERMTTAFGLLIVNYN